MSVLASKLLKQRAFSLLEMIIALLIFSLMAGMLSLFIAVPLQNWQLMQQRVELASVASIASQRLNLELRRARAGSLQINMTGNPSLQFIDENNQTVRYVCQLNTGELRRVTTQSYLLALHVNQCQWSLSASTHGRAILSLLLEFGAENWDGNFEKITVFQQIAIKL